MNKSNTFSFLSSGEKSGYTFLIPFLVVDTIFLFETTHNTNCLWSHTQPHTIFVRRAEKTFVKCTEYLSYKMSFSVRFPAYCWGILPCASISVDFTTTPNASVFVFAHESTPETKLYDFVQPRTGKQTAKLPISHFTKQARNSLRKCTFAAVRENVHDGDFCFIVQIGNARTHCQGWNFFF